MTKTFTVRLEAFLPYEVNAERKVTVPRGSWVTFEGMLDQVFMYGQNDFQPLPVRSVSMGDVIETEQGDYRVGFVGFERMTA